MHRPDADQRFMLVLAISLVVVALLGIVRNVDLRPGGAKAAGSGETIPTAERYVMQSRALFGRAASPRETVLQPLLTASPDARFPRLMPSLTTPIGTVLGKRLIVSYYGNPYTDDMGVLGKGSPEALADRIEEHAARYDELNGAAGAIGAFHLVYGVAQPHPAEGGRYLYYMDDADVLEYVRLAEERGMLVFLDLQIGRSTIEAELERVLPFLEAPNVHLALDPEFAMGAGEVPGDTIGSLRAADINQAQAALQELVTARRLPPKLLIVHQFLDSMVLDGEEIERFANVELIIDADGFGPASTKRALYERYASQSYATHAAIKLFFEYDTDLMPEEDVLALEPPPVAVIYQ